MTQARRSGGHGRSFALDDAIELGRVDTGGSHDVVADDEHVALTDGTHAQLGLPGHAELPHDEHLQRSVESDGDLEGHGHAATGQTEHHRIGEVAPGQLLAQRSAGGAAVGEGGWHPARRDRVNGDRATPAHQRTAGGGGAKC